MRNNAASATFVCFNKYNRFHHFILPFLLILYKLLINYKLYYAITYFLSIISKDYFLTATAKASYGLSVIPNKVSGRS
ncbi:hypothetical protein GCM10011628_09540 [Lactobacillus acetotolerans DSM 20749 = JCM 3825]|nr:hypothetical protein GCM10011628_09540 [Lactobacillus acetotolerans DSM 20749 = JCM 3825]